MQHTPDSFDVVVVGSGGGALAGAAGGLLSGLVFAWVDFRGLGFWLAALALIVVAAVRPRRARELQRQTLGA